MAGQGKEDVIQAGRSQADLGHRNLECVESLDQSGQNGRVGDVSREFPALNVSDWLTSGQLGNHPLHQVEVDLVLWSDDQRLASDLGLELVRRTGGHDAAVVEDRN